MPTYEHIVTQTYKDSNGDKHLVYPITKIECVDGLEEALSEKQVTDGIIILSSTINSTKKFKITVDDSGTLSVTETI